MDPTLDDLTAQLLSAQRPESEHEWVDHEPQGYLACGSMHCTKYRVTHSCSLTKNKAPLCYRLLIQYYMTQS